MMTLAQAALALQVQHEGADTPFGSVVTDSRAIPPCALFVALRGERFDGHDFIAQAQAAGAVAAMVDSAYVSRCDLPLLRVPDTRLALGALGAHWRRQFTLPLVAVTGSNGKTTVKEMLAAILRAAAGSETAVLATRGNLNNDIGMPLTLLGLRASHRYAVIEMGMNHAGELDQLTRWAAPDVALINNAGGAHLEGLGTVEAVARAKGEIFAGLGAQGCAVINADDAHAPLWRDLAGTHRRIEFGLTPVADIRGAVWADGRLQLQTPQGEVTLRLQVPGAHNARNALAAAAAAEALNVSLSAIVQGLQAFTGVPGRLQRRIGRHGATVLDDTYNANPASMLAAIDVLAAQPGRCVLVIGDMGELGADAAARHAEIGARARAAGLGTLLALGPLSREAVQTFGAGGQHFETVEALLAALLPLLTEETSVLVKGSRFMKMERVVAACLEREDTCCSH